MIFPKDWSTMKKLAFLQQSGCSAIAVDTASGNPVAFTTDFAKPLRRLAITMLPHQSGTGDPAPDNVRPLVPWQGLTAWRTGKNLYDKSKQTKIPNNTYISISLKPNTDYVFSTDTTITGLYVGYSDADEMPSVSGQGWSSLSYMYNTTSLAFNSGSHKWYRLMTYETNGVVSDRLYQLELGSTATTYAPYTGESFPVVFPAQGKNLIHDYYTLSDNVVIINQTEQYNLAFKTFLKAGTYTLSATCANATYLYYKRSNGDTAHSTATTTPSITFTVETDGDYSFWAYRGSGVTPEDITNLQLEKSEQKTPYEPYTNTVYGGTLDLVSGVLTVTHVIKDLGSLNYTRVSGSDGVYVFTTAGFSDKKLGVTNIISDLYATTAVTSWGATKPDNSICGSATSTTVVIRADAYTDASSLKTALDGHVTVYELATPITYQLDPVTVNALVGVNTIWSDGDVVDVAYLKKR